MADKKISALTGATTPLAGTEVLPIVQGGATVKVSVADLTTGRAVSASSVTISGLTASTALALDASKNVVSVTNTGTGSNVLATSPVFVTEITTPLVKTNSGTVSATSGVAVTIYAVPAAVNRNYIVCIGLSASAPTVYNAVSIVSVDNAVMQATALQIAALASISVSGQNIQATQSSGGSQTLYWTVTCVS
jgi:hypothetical protein